MVKITKDSVNRYARVMIDSERINGIIVVVAPRNSSCSFLAEDNRYFVCVIPDEILEIGNKIGNDTGLSVDSTIFYRYDGKWYCIRADGKMGIGETPEKAENSGDFLFFDDNQANLILTAFDGACEKTISDIDKI